MQIRRKNSAEVMYTLKRICVGMTKTMLLWWNYFTIVLQNQSKRELEETVIFLYDSGNKRCCTILAREQALLFGRVKRVSRERASERRSLPKKESLLTG